MDSTSRILQWISEDEFRMSALRQAKSLKLPDWCLAAGFVRNLVWDVMHGCPVSTPLNDIDLIYFNRTDTSKQSDVEFEARLAAESDIQLSSTGSLSGSPLGSPKWSVKNQARMHIRNGHRAYTSTSDAMRFWPEVETAIGVYMAADNTLHLVAPFGVESLLQLCVTPNDRCTDTSLFSSRVTAKQWLQRWPDLLVKF